MASEQAVSLVGLKEQYQHLKSAIDARIAAVLAHGQFILGPEVAEFETELARYCGAAQAITCANGTDALQIILMAYDVGPGDAVFLPSFTFTATAEIVVLLGATPVFVDVDERDFNIDLTSLETAIHRVENESRLKPRAIIAVDLFGLPADYVALNRIADEHGLHLIADAAQSFGASYGNSKVGSLAPATTLSFFPAKPLGCYGDGGAVLVQDPAIADILRSIRSHGKGAEKYDIVRLGVNSRLDTLQAAVLLAKLPNLDAELQARSKLADFYGERLAALVTTPIRRPGRTSAWAQYSILTPKRDEVVKKLLAEGIPTSVFYPKPMHLQPAYRKFSGDETSLPVSELLSQQVLSLPMHPFIEDAVAEWICDAVRHALI